MFTKYVLMCVNNEHIDSINTSHDFGQAFSNIRRESHKSWRCNNSVSKGVRDLPMFSINSHSTKEAVIFQFDLNPLRGQYNPVVTCGLGKVITRTCKRPVALLI